MTLAERYHEAAARLLPHMAANVTVDPSITDANHTNKTVFHRSEYLGGMALAILAMIDQHD